MRKLLDELKKEELSLQQILAKIPENKKKLINGSLNISSRGEGKSPQYYLVQKDDKNGYVRHFLRRKDQQIAIEIAQRDYDEKVLIYARKQLAMIQRLIKTCEENNLFDIYTNLSEHRKELIKPRVLSDAEYIKQWLAVTYEKKNFYEGGAEYFTEKGERVRSKSEKIIADMLLRAGIPYRYEYPIILKGYGSIHPDFTVLDVKNRKEIYWEHLGKMGNSEYIDQNLPRINAYMKNGFTYGNGLITTFESTAHPLETTVILKIIQDLRKTL